MRPAIRASGIRGQAVKAAGKRATTNRKYARGSDGKARYPSNTYAKTGMFCSVCRRQELDTFDDDICPKCHVLIGR